MDIKHGGFIINATKYWYLDGVKIEYDPETWDQKVQENKVNRIKNIMET